MGIKRSCLSGIMFIFMLLVAAGCAGEESPRPLQMYWGIADEVRGFEGLEREPEGKEVERVDENILQVTWKVGEQYILPISAAADQELVAVRYVGKEIPQSLELEWLDPRAGKWYALPEIPAAMIKFHIQELNGFYTLDFGPPDGAVFREDMYRVIWFRITPTEKGSFSFKIYGYQDEGEPFSEDPVSNTLNLELEAIR